MSCADCEHLAECDRAERILRRILDELRSREATVELDHPTVVRVERPGGRGFVAWVWPRSRSASYAGRGGALRLPGPLCGCKLLEERLGPLIDEIAAEAR